MFYEIKYKKDGRRKTLYVLEASSVYEAVQKAANTLKEVEEVYSIKPLPLENE